MSRSPCNGNHFSSNSGIIITTGISSVLVIHSFNDFKVALLLIIIICLLKIYKIYCTHKLTAD